MAPDNSHGPADYNRAFAFGVALNLGYIAVEATFGIMVGSPALLANAGHNLSDVLGLLLAWGAIIWYSASQPSVSPMAGVNLRFRQRS